MVRMVDMVRISKIVGKAHQMTILDLNCIFCLTPHGFLGGCVSRFFCSLVFVKVGEMHHSPTQALILCACMAGPTISEFTSREALQMVHWCWACQT